MEFFNTPLSFKGQLDARGFMVFENEVHGLFGAVENMPDGNAYRPDDIIKAMNGKTIEIKNTDAEGRVARADMLAYTSILKPDAIIDMATLTGAAVTALGNYTAGLVSDWDDLIRELLEDADKAGERFHRFIMDVVELSRLGCF